MTNKMITSHLQQAYDALKKITLNSTDEAIEMGIALGQISYLIADLKEEEETFSNCCGVPMDTDDSFCPGCHEHAVCVNENNEEVE